MRALRAFLRKLNSDESGQSLVVVICSMTVLLGIAAFGIDTASWMARHHQAQVVADAAALAAADCLANPGQPGGSIVLHGTQTAVPGCTSPSDTTDAQQVAIDYAAANGVAITANQVTIANNTVKVATAATTSAVFSTVSGISSTSQTAAAGASWTNSTGACSTPGSGCDFMFAHDTNCGSQTNGIDITQNGNLTINGDLQSNSNLDLTTNGNPSFGSGSYGPSSNGACNSYVNANGHNPWSSQPTQATSNVPYPVDYSTDFPACGGNGLPACQTNGYPSFCTVAGSSITLNGSTNGDYAIDGNIYCASGTGAPSDPSTWNGTITITMTGKNVLYDTFVGGSISFSGSGNDTLSSCGYTVSGYAASACSSAPSPVTSNYPVFYATGTSSTAIDVNVSGGQTINGDMFAPNGGATLSMSGNQTLTSFIEANDITASIGGTFQGDGPNTTGIGGVGAGSVTLSQ